jgi:hypothetical protein
MRRPFKPLDFPLQGGAGRGVVQNLIVQYEETHIALARRGPPREKHGWHSSRQAPR